MGRYQSVKEFTLDLLFPRYCISCSKEGQLFCDPCLYAMDFQKGENECPFCGLSSKDSATCTDCKKEVYLDGLIHLAPYANRMMRSLIEHYKYHGDEQALEYIRLLLQKSAPGIPWGVIVPVPLAKARERQRGYDQAKEIAKVLAEVSGHEYLDCLTRIIWTKPRAQLSREKRLVGDLDNIFATKGLLPLGIILVDDVFTSGATMDAAAKVLKEQGVQSVWGFTLAKG